MFIFVISFYLKLNKCGLDLLLIKRICKYNDLLFLIFVEENRLLGYGFLIEVCLI